MLFVAALHTPFMMFALNRLVCCPQRFFKILQHAKFFSPVLHVITIQFALHEQDVLNVDFIAWPPGKHFQDNQVFRRHDGHFEILVDFRVLAARKYSLQIGRFGKKNIDINRSVTDRNAKLHNRHTSDGIHPTPSIRRWNNISQFFRCFEEFG